MTEGEVVMDLYMKTFTDLEKCEYNFNIYI